MQSMNPQKYPLGMLCMRLLGKFKSKRKWAATGFYDINKQSYISDDDIDSNYWYLIWGRIFSHVRPFHERAVSDLDP
jgi:hypothetical protein